MTSKDTSKNITANGGPQALYRGKTAQQWGKDLRDGDPDVRKKAVKALRTMGWEAKAVLPELAPLVSDPSSEVRLATIDAIAVLARKILTEKPQTSGNREQDLAREKACVLQNFQELVSTAMPSIIDCIREDKAAIRLVALRVVERIGCRFSSDIKVLAFCIENSNSNVRKATISCMCKLFPQVSSRSQSCWRKLILEARTDSTPMVRKEALGALRKINVSGHKLMSICLEALDDPNDLVAEQAGKQLALELANMPLLEFSAIYEISFSLQFPPSPERKVTTTLLPPNSSDLLDEVGKKRQTVGLDNIQQGYKPDLTSERYSALRILAWNTCYGSTRIRRASLQCFSRLASPIFLPELISACEDSDACVRRLALVRLREIGVHAQTASSQVIARMGDPDADVRAAAVAALKVIGYGIEEATARLLDALDDSVPAVRNAAAHALGPSGDIYTDSRIVTALAKALSDESEDVCLQSVVSLERLLGKNPGAFTQSRDQIIPLLEDVRRRAEESSQSEPVRSNALLRTAAFAHKLTHTLTDETHADMEAYSDPDVEKEAITDLVQQLLHAKRHGDRRRAAEGLRDYGSDAEKAVPALMQAVTTKWKKDRFGTIRRAALQTLAVVAPHDNRTADVVLTALQEDESWTVREHAVFALKRIPDNYSNRMGESLKKALRDPSDRVVWAASKALTELGTTAGCVFKDYLDLINSTPDPSMREHFVRAAGGLLTAQRKGGDENLPAESRSALQAIAEQGMGDTEKVVRREASKLLKELDGV